MATWWYDVAIMEVGVRALKNGLSSYLERARRGEVIVITDRGVPIAKLEAVRTDALPARVRHLVDSRRLVYKKPHSTRLPVPVEMTPGNKTAVEYVLEQRR